MRIAAICPTYGRPALAANALACFLAQDHPAEDRFLLILDDAGTIAGDGPNWYIYSTSARYPTLIHKYLRMVGLLHILWPQPGWDALALMDDDDIYGPQWLSSHALALASLPQPGWSYPSQVLSLYGRDVSAGDPPLREPSGGRFWASVALSRELYERSGGFLSSAARRDDFDQVHLRHWLECGGEPGRPDESPESRVQSPESPLDPRRSTLDYCYGWGRSNHGSALMGSGRSQGDWYDRARMMDPTCVDPLVPKMDETTAKLYATVWA